LELLAGGDAQLAEHLAQVPLDERVLMNSSAAISGLVRPSRASRAMCSSCGGEVVEGVGLALADLPAGGQQLPARSFCEPLAPIETNASNATRRHEQCGGVALSAG
jgi:hypothetical protein